MAIVTGGWTVDPIAVEVLDEEFITPIFRAMVKTVLINTLTAIEIAGTLSTEEKNLQTELIGRVGNPEWVIDRAIGFIKLEISGYWTVRGMYMLGSEIQICITNQWENILKGYV
jgi:hypothetical protein